MYQVDNILKILFALSTQLGWQKSKKQDFRISFIFFPF